MSEIDDIKKSGYDVGVSENTGTTPAVNPNDPSSGVQPGADLTKSTKITIGRYLSKLTSGQYASEEKNYYPVDSTNKTEIKLTTPAGSPAALSNNNSDTFARDLDSSYSRDYPNIRSSLAKGREDIAKDWNGNTLLPGVVPSAPDANSDPLTQKYTSPSLARNRFTPSAIRGGGDLGALYTKGTEKNVDLIRKSVSPEDLAKVGKTLTLRSTGELQSGDPGYNPNNNVGALLPGSAQLLISKVDTRTLEARSVLQAIIGEDIGTQEEGPAQESWGSLNNVLEPFSGILPIGMTTLAIALILAAQISLRVVLAVVGLIYNPASSRYDVHGIAPLGRFYFSEAQKDQFGGFDPGGISNLSELLGLPVTQNPFPAAVGRGIDVFFRSDTPADNGVLGQIAAVAAGSFKAALESPGFYAIFVRSIIRSGQEIAKEIGNIGGNPISAAQDILGILETLRRSKIISAIGLFALLGDAALNEGSFAREFDVDSYPDGLSSQHKSRLTNSRQLAWRNSNIASAYLFPRSMGIAASLYTKGNLVDFGALGADTKITSDSPDNIDSKKTNIVSVDGTNKLSTDTVAKIEEALEAEYVPFYFQDLRTNEVIAFQAFIGGITDGFTVGWEQSEPYGRVDQIRTYKNTQRAISVQFYIVSADPYDFDQNWLKINKLVSLAYPQWSAGKQAQVQGEKSFKFVQPFTQTPSASPVFRIRLGDLFKSNYSKFSLARLFGAGQIDNFSAGEQKTRFDLQDLARTSEELSAIRSQMRAVSGKDFKEPVSRLASLDQKNKIIVKLRPGKVYPVYTSAGAGALGRVLAAAVPAVGSSSKTKPYSNRFLRPAEVKIESITNVSGIVVTVKEETEEQLSKLLVSFDDLLITPIARAAGDTTTSGPSDGSGILDNFLSADNPIVKAYRSAGGKGLACTLNSINFDWMKGQWETSDRGSKAPMMCVVDMSLTPIHDISPGIDSDGALRAPVYNVGNIVHSIAGSESSDALAGTKNGKNQKPSNDVAAPIKHAEIKKSF